MGATVETIQISNDTPHNFGAVTRWMVMYPSHAQSHTRTSPRMLCVWQPPSCVAASLLCGSLPGSDGSCHCRSEGQRASSHCVYVYGGQRASSHCVYVYGGQRASSHCVYVYGGQRASSHCVYVYGGQRASSHCVYVYGGQRASSHCVYVYGVESTGEWKGMTVNPLEGNC